MKIIKQKMKVLRGFFQYGEIKQIAAQNNIATDRAWPIARGRISPRPEEIGFAQALINIALPRMEQLKRFEKVPIAYEGDKGATMGMGY
jgi:hypothetical protein